MDYQGGSSVETAIEPSLFPNACTFAIDPALESAPTFDDTAAKSDAYRDHDNLYSAAFFVSHS
jgi:hypothetical protein